MAYDARVLQILIISPGDVQEEREIVSQVVFEWNYVNSRDRSIVLLPLRWETHATPEMGQRPQAVINRQVVDYCDMAIGVFWTRLGTPTGEAESGSAEEITRVVDAGKPVMLYFSRGKVDLQATDLDEYRRLVSFKEELYQKALIESYSTLNEFRETLTRQLALRVRDVIAQDSSSQVGAAPETEVDKITLMVGTTSVVPADGASIDFTATNSVELSSPIIHDEEKIPDYKTPGPVTTSSDVSLWRVNSDFVSADYYRQTVDYYREYNLRRYLWISIINSSDRSIRDIHLDIRMYSSTDDIVLGIKEMTAPSKTGFNFTASSGRTNAMVKTTAHNEWRSEIDIPIVQAQRTVTAPTPILMRAAADGTIKFEATVYSSDSPPFSLNTELKISVKPTNPISYQDILKRLAPDYSKELTSSS
jgi:hypothetical protein